MQFFDVGLPVVKFFVQDYLLISVEAGQRGWGTPKPSGGLWRPAMFSIWGARGGADDFLQIVT